MTGIVCSPQPRDLLDEIGLPFQVPAGTREWGGQGDLAMHEPVPAPGAPPALAQWLEPAHAFFGGRDAPSSISAARAGRR